MSSDERKRNMKTANVKQSEAVAMRSSASRCELVLCSSSSGQNFGKEVDAFFQLWTSISRSRPLTIEVKRVICHEWWFNVLLLIQEQKSKAKSPLPCNSFCAGHNGVGHRLGSRLGYSKRHSKTCRVQVCLLTAVSNGSTKGWVRKNGKSRKTKETGSLCKWRNTAM